MRQLPTLIDRFIEPWSFLSNFYSCTVEYEGEVYHSVENAYQAAKAADPKRRSTFQLPGVTSGQAKSLGRKLIIRPDWDEVRVDIMRDLLLQKFYPTILRRKLLSTFAATLVEGNYWHDEFWGVCDGGCRQGPHEPNGKNMLGILLMDTRIHFGGLKEKEPEK